MELRIPFLHRRKASLEQRFGRPIDLIVLAAYKAFFGTLEILAGIAILIMTFVARHLDVAHLLQSMVADELQDDPQDLMVRWLLANTERLTSVTAIHFGVIVVILGAVKVAIAAALWSRSPVARTAGMVFFGGVAAYGIMALLLKFSPLKLAALLIDLAVLYYFWKVLPRHIVQPKPNA